jgi:hypothetical protein
MTPVDEELAKRRLLHEFKKVFGKDPEINRSPFTEGVIVRYDTDVQPWDVPEIHQKARQQVTAVLKAIRREEPSQIVLLAGEAGMGKSHLLNYFRSHERSEELGYVLVHSSNFWKVAEFEERLLDQIISVLVRPSPNQPHLLLQQIQLIAFAALDQLMTRQQGSYRQYLTKRNRGFFGRLWDKVTAWQQVQFQQMVQKRDPGVFRRLNFPKFAGYVCDQFLYDPSHPFHRYALHVMLRYLFEEDRESVLAWLRGRKVNESFLHKVGSEDAIDRKYKVMDVVQILISLFTPEVTNHLGPEGKGRDRVFFLVFDQMEACEELFSSEDEWFTFFAKLSEVYNSLPNVLVLFTMTLKLYNQMHPKLERQFQQRIRRDPNFVLHEVENSEVLTLFRKRIDSWLQEAPAHVRREVDAPAFRYLPMTQEEVLQLAEQKTLREMLFAFDQSFRDGMIKPGPDPRLDYLVSYKELRQARGQEAPFVFTEGHLATVTQLFNEFGQSLAKGFGLRFGGFNRSLLDNSAVDALALEFYPEEGHDIWVRVFLVRLTFRFGTQLDKSIDLLHRREIKRNFLWVLRAETAYPEWAERRPGQVFPRELSVEAEMRLRTILHLLHNRERYVAENAWEDVEKLVVEEVRPLYLGDMMRQVRGALDELIEQMAPATQPTGLPEPATSSGQPQVAEQIPAQVAAEQPAGLLAAASPPVDHTMPSPSPTSSGAQQVAAAPQVAEQIPVQVAATPQVAAGAPQVAAAARRAPRQRAARPAEKEHGESQPAARSARSTEEPDEKEAPKS